MNLSSYCICNNTDCPLHSKERNRNLRKEDPLYRATFKGDIFKDLSKLENSYTGNQTEGAEFQIEELEIISRHPIREVLKAL